MIFHLQVDPIQNVIHRARLQTSAMYDLDARALESPCESVQIILLKQSPINILINDLKLKHHKIISKHNYMS